MNLLYLVGTIWILLLVSFAINFDNRRPMSTNLRYKYRVKDTSVFRKIIKFKDKKGYPYNYFKIVPLYIFLLFAIISFLLLLIDIFSYGFITNTVPENVFVVSLVCLLGGSVTYFLVITIWWEIVDYREMKFTKEEKALLKETRRKVQEDKRRND